MQATLVVYAVYIILNITEGTKMEEKNYSEADIENFLNIMDGFGNSEVGRLKFKVDEQEKSGDFSYAYHHGRCDIGSPYARGECFDAPLSDCDR